MVSFNSVNLHYDETGKTFLALEITIQKDGQTIIMMFDIPETVDTSSPLKHSLCAPEPHAASDSPESLI